MPSPKNASCLGLLCLLGALPAHAHDPFQATTNIWLRPDGMEVELIMALSPASHIVGDLADAPITEDNFYTIYQPRLADRAPSLFEISVNNATVQPLSVNVSLTDDLNVRFDLLYPPPTPGNLHLYATFFGKMEDSFDNSIIVLRQQSAIGVGDQNAGQLTYDINLTPPLLPPPASPAPATPPVISAAPPASPVAGPRSANRLWLGTATGLFLALAVLAALASRRNTRR